ncbi:flagellar biosynthesis protein FlgA [Mycobacterium sp. MS1601]|uniref:SAF domain-containing protein n=1 Tax=Mycobacterium sp. MS1601 TaxID=1936029 RepID=UPI0009795241|nr:SAF domain-containing protein [Mycobacterium sp. MS1601]AQA02116.1 flagellar biosynthesis protein FlgA [Mycobacterium sp. MS1601]
MPHSLDPTAFNRLRQALQPDWVHSVRARRGAAAALVILAGVAALRSEPGGAHRDAVIAGRDLSPGVTMTAEDLVVVSRPVDTLPEGALSDAGTAVGATPAGPVRSGEVLTDVRVLGPRLTESAAGPGARVVPVQLAQSAILDVVREGDVVDIVAAPQDGPLTDVTPRVIAVDAVVVLISPDAEGLGARADRVILVALPAAAAVAVAAATLGEVVTLTLH